MAETGVTAAIDAGGTTFKCLLSSADRQIIAQGRVPTTTPDETVAACRAFFDEAARTANVDIVRGGIASFGPLDVDPRSSRFGSVLDTPKAGWSGYNLRAAVSDALGISMAIDTDVNAALLAEAEWGSAQGCETAAYVTVGTGIGVGAMSAGRLLGAPSHPEFGHIRVQRHPKDQDFPGVCSFHSDCLEGLASAPAIWRRFGDPAMLTAANIGTEIIGFYLGQLSYSIALMLRTDRIILGGGILQNDAILAAARHAFEVLDGGYVGVKSDVIVKPHLLDDAGAWGAFWLAAHQK